MKFNKWQIIGIIILSIAFLTIYSCKTKQIKRRAEKTLIRHELEKEKDHVIDRVKPHWPTPKPNKPLPYIRPYNIR